MRDGWFVLKTGKLQCFGRWVPCVLLGVCRFIFSYDKIIMMIKRERERAIKFPFHIKLSKIVI